MPARVSKALASKLIGSSRDQLANKPVGSNKYNAKRTCVGNLSFASKAEAKRYCLLRLLQDQGEISNLQLQPKFPLMVYGQKVAIYIADFQYTLKNGKVVIEDVKGVTTPVFTIKRNLMRACLGVEVQVVR